MTRIYIATYLASSQWDLDALGITTPAEIESLYTKWNKLYVTRLDENGDEYEEEFSPELVDANDADFKHSWKEGVEEE